MSIATQQHGNNFEAYMARLDAQLAARPARVVRTIDVDQLTGRIARHREEWAAMGRNLDKSHVTVQEMYMVFGDILTDLGVEDAETKIMGEGHDR